VRRNGVTSTRRRGRTQLLGTVGASNRFFKLTRSFFESFPKSTEGVEASPTYYHLILHLLNWDTSNVNVVIELTKSRFQRELTFRVS
jgi:hypothetical protein